IAEWLTSSNLRAIWMDTIAKKAPGTGVWFVRRDDFQQWMNNDGELLCGIGIPGAGKTILCATIIEYLQDVVKSSEGNVCVTFAFFRYTDKQSTIKSTLAALLRQQLERHPRTFEPIKALYNLHDRERTNPSKDELLTLLRQTSAMYRKNYFILDAFDEAPKEVQEEILQCLLSLNANVLVMSRPSILPSDIVGKTISAEIYARPSDIKILID
ncbi:hypothetical protein FA15DRAFT_559510, partial [Coprinopsis marcescibilis]